LEADLEPPFLHAKIISEELRTAIIMFKKKGLLKIAWQLYSHPRSLPSSAYHPPGKHNRRIKIEIM